MKSPYAPVCNARYFDNLMTIARECPADTIEFAAMIALGDLENPNTCNPNIVAIALDEMERIYRERFTAA